MSAALVATPRQRIADKTINAASCDIGIYIGAGVSNVTVDSVKVTGASYIGVLAEKTSHVMIEHSIVTGNGLQTIVTSPAEQNAKDAYALDGGSPTHPLYSLVSQSFGISLFGVSDSAVTDNTVSGNGRGGIGLMDNGPNDPGALFSKQNRKARVINSSDDQIVGNHTSQNAGGCAIVAATQNFGGRLSNVVISKNTVLAGGPASAHDKAGPNPGGIVVAADLPDSALAGVHVSDNSVTGSLQGGVVVNAEAFNSSTQHVVVQGNHLTANNWGHAEAPNTAGIVVFANPGWKTSAPAKGAHAPVNAGTTITGNTATGQYYGVWSTGGQAPNVSRNKISVSAGGTPIARA
ncbi:MAG: right-handed parallel beta-helix repeat-containing protein [Solirubrobacteraceae bacterium]